MFPESLKAVPGARASGTPPSNFLYVFIHVCKSQHFSKDQATELIWKSYMAQTQVSFIQIGKIDQLGS